MVLSERTAAGVRRVGCTPWVWQVLPDYRLQSHTGLQTSAGNVFGRRGAFVYRFAPRTRFGALQDMVLAAEAVEQGVWVPRDVVSADLPVQYGFVRSPCQVTATLSSSSCAQRSDAGC